MSHRLLGAALVGALALPTADATASENMQGGRIVTQNQGFVEVGYPHLKGGVRLPLSDTFELTPYGQFSYGYGFGVGALSFTPGVDGRLQLLDTGDLQGALTFGLGVHLGFGAWAGGFAAGLALGNPGWRMNYAITDQVDLDFGIAFYPDLFFAPGGVFFRGAIPFIVGAEGEIAEGVQIGGRIEVGPGFASFGGGGFGAGVGVFGYGEFILTAGFSF